MAWHDVLYPNVVKAIAGDFNFKPTGFVENTINYGMMSSVATCLHSPTIDNIDRYLDILTEMRREGHLARRGPKGVGTEAGAPAMHWTFNIGPPAGMTLRAMEEEELELSKRVIKKPIPKRSMVITEGLNFLCNEYQLDKRHTYIYRDEKRKLTLTTALPCPRAKDEKDQKPYGDKYRDISVALLSGKRVRKSVKYWNEPQSLAIRCIRDLLALKPSLLGMFREAGYPKLAMEIHKQDIGHNGDYIAYIEDTPENRRMMGRDCCNWVRCVDKKITFGYDWSEVPTS